MYAGLLLIQFNQNNPELKYFLKCNRSIYLYRSTSALYTMLYLYVRVTTRSFGIKIARAHAAEASVAKGTSFHVIIIDLAMTGCNAHRRRTPSSHHVNKRRWLLLFDAIFSLFRSFSSLAQYMMLVHNMFDYVRIHSSNLSFCLLRIYS